MLVNLAQQEVQGLGGEVARVVVLVDSIYRTRVQVLGVGVDYGFLQNHLPNATMTAGAFWNLYFF